MVVVAYLDLPAVPNGVHSCRCCTKWCGTHAPTHASKGYEMNSNSERVAGLVRRARRSRSWTQDDLAHEAGVAPGTVGSIELGKKVRPGSLRAVLDALALSPDAMDDAGGADDPTTADVQLVLDVVRKFLEGKQGEDRTAAVHALIRWTVQQP